MSEQIITVNNSQLSKLIANVEKSKSASAKSKAQKALDSYISSATVSLFFADNSLVKVFNAEKNARKYLRDNGYRTCLLIKEREDDKRIWNHRLAYTGSHGKITNDINKYPIRDYEESEMNLYLKEQKESKAQKEQSKA